MRPSVMALLGAGALWSCAEARIQSSQDDAATAEGGLGASAYEVGLQAESSGLWVVAEEGGGGAVHADRPGRGPWETFTLVDVNGGALRHGDSVELRTHDQLHWLEAAGGGGAAVTATAQASGPHARFELVRADGAGPVVSGDRVGLRAAGGQYVVAEEGGGGAVNANRGRLGPWETFVLALGPGAAVPGTGGGAGSVLPQDTVLLPPGAPKGAVLGTITGYEMNSHCPFSDEAKCERPLYLKYDRDDPEWWDVLVQELLASRVNVVMAHGRGCYDPSSGDTGNGNMCPRLLRHLVAAIDRAQARGVLRLGMWDDTGAYQGTRNAVDHLPESERFDLQDRTSWRFFWDHNMRIWFDVVPRDLWYRLNGRPVVAFWSLSSYFFKNQTGNASALLRDLRAKFQARYGEDPIFILDSTWVHDDPTVTVSEGQGLNDWFDPSRSVFTYRSWGGATWGATVPGFRDPDTFAGCGAPCREQGRRDGAALREALVAGQGARFTLLEGWTDVAESAGYYRSDAWRYPNQYINLVREYSDPGLATLKLEAEAADAFDDTSPGNLGGTYRGGALDVGRLPEPAGWFVGWTEAGESLTFKEVALPCGTWRLTGRVAAPSPGARLRVEVGGRALAAVEVPATGGWDSYGLVHLGEVKLGATRGDVRVVFETGGQNLDWVFLRRASPACPP